MIFLLKTYCCDTANLQLLVESNNYNVYKIIKTQYGLSGVYSFHLGEELQKAVQYIRIMRLITIQ